MKFIGISGALAGHKTSQMVFEVLQAVKKINANIETELIDLKDYDIEFVRGLPLSYYNDDTQAVVQKIMTADCIIIGTPVYQASIPGSLKNLFDFLPEMALKSKVVGYISTAGSEKYFLIAEYHLRPVIQFLGATVPSKNVFVRDDYFDDENVISDKDIKKRIQNLAKDIIHIKENLN